MKDELIKKEKELQEQKQIEQKKEKKSIQIFVIVLIIGLIAGIGAGMFARNMKDVISNLGVIISQNRDLLSIIVSSVMLLMNMGMAIICFIQCRMLKRQVADWRVEGENEEELDLLEYRMNIPIIITSIGMVINFFLIAMNWRLGISEAELTPIANMMTGLGNAIFCLSFVIEMAVQNRILKLEKELNPEKKGSIFNINFQKEWLGSCDEAERLVEYKSGFRAYMIGQYVCIGLWLFCIIVQLTFDIGIMPIICLTIVWLTLVCTFLFEHLRLEKLSRGL